MRQIITKIALSSSIFFMASCGMFEGEEEEVNNEVALVAENPVAETEPVEEINSAPVVLEDEVETNEIQRLPTKSDGPHIIKRDGKYWIIAEPSAQIANVINSLNKHTEGLNYEPSPGYLRLARELNYRINEMAFNTGATTEDYKELFEKSLETIEAVAIAEAEANRACSSCASSCDEDEKLDCDQDDEQEDTELEDETEEK